MSDMTLFVDGRGYRFYHVETALRVCIWLIIHFVVCIIKACIVVLRKHPPFAILLMSDRGPYVHQRRTKEFFKGGGGGVVLNVTF